MKKLIQAVESVGLKFSIKNLIGILIGIEGAIIAASLLYLLDAPYMIILLVLGLISTPYIYWFNIKYKYEKEKYEDLCDYMDQMYSSFLSKPKIYHALKETSEVLEGKKIKEYVDSAIDFFETKQGSYKNALKLIEKEYECKNLNLLHKLLIKVEEEGGRYTDAISILTKETGLWKDRTSVFQAEKRTLRANYIVALIISIISCSLATFLAYIAHSTDIGNFDRLLDITPLITYQLIAFAFLVMCIISFYLINRSYTSSWIKNNSNKKMILDDYDTCLNFDVKAKTLKILPFGLIFIVLGIVLCLSVGVLGIALIILGIIFLISPKMKYSSALKSTTRELKEAFSLWLIDLELNLQFNTPHMAIIESYKDAPVILKEPLQQLIKEIDKDMTGIAPYNNFLKEFNIPEVAQTMRKIYSMRELNSNNTQEILKDIMDRNYKLQEYVEKENTKQKIQNVKLFIYIPMAFAMFKVVADLLIFSSTFFNGFGDFSSFM